MEIDKFKIKIRQFSSELESKLDREQDCILTVPVGIESVETTDNQDGTYDMVYKAKMNGAIDIRQLEKITKGKDKSKTSKKNRDFCWIIGEGYNVVDHQTFYEDFYQTLRANPDIADLIISKMTITKYK